MNYGATTNLSYFDNGNIQSKTGLAGNYQYNAAQPHAVSRAGGISYSYDANGNNTSSSDGRTIEYTVFDKADLITKGNYRTQFDYGIGHSRYQRVDESKTPSTQVRQTRYLLKDHLGSIHTVLSDTSTVDERMHFGAFGERMEALDWQVPASPARQAFPCRCASKPHPASHFPE